MLFSLMHTPTASGESIVLDYCDWWRGLESRVTPAREGLRPEPNSAFLGP